MNASFRLAGVIGYPVAHSLSPRLHGYWLKDLCGRGDYIPLSVSKERFSQVVQALQEAHFHGVNVTLPHKHAAFALCRTLDKVALQTGAVNLLLFRENGVEGRNTDVHGLRISLAEEFGVAVITDRKVAILGAGGAARAAALAVDELGAAEIHILARREGRAQQLVSALQSMVQCPLSAHGWEDWPQIGKGVSLLVNATSAGMKGASSLDLSLEPLSEDAAAFDLVYNPLETPLLKNARNRGHRTANGLGMLIHQAVPAFEAFYGTTPKVTPELRANLEQAITGD